MQKLSFKNMSVLGLVLMGASALTAAVVPDKEDKANSGRLLQQSASGLGPVAILSCVAASSPLQCTATVLSGNATPTTVGSLQDSFVGTPQTDQTVGNTSQDINGVDQTSVVQ